MKHNLTVPLAVWVALLILFTGCSKHSTAVDVAKDEADIAKIRANIVQQKEDRQQDRLESELDKTPAWALHPIRPDATGMYAVGMADSISIRVAVNEARLRAEFGLAKLYKKELTGNERDFQRDSGGDDIRVQYQKLIDELVQASIVGEEIVKQEVHPINGRVHAWVLMKLPYDEFNKVLKEQRMQTRDKAIQSAFDDMERRLDKRRKQAVEDAKAQHDMKMDEVKVRNDLLLENQKASKIAGQPKIENKPGQPVIQPIH